MQGKETHLEGENFLAEIRVVDEKVKKRKGVQEALELAEAPR